MLSAGEGTGRRDRAGIRLEAVVAAALAGVVEGPKGLEVGQEGG